MLGVTIVMALATPVHAPMNIGVAELKPPIRIVSGPKCKVSWRSSTKYQQKLLIASNMGIGLGPWKVEHHMKKKVLTEAERDQLCRMRQKDRSIKIVRRALPTNQVQHAFIEDHKEPRDYMIRQLKYKKPLSQKEVAALLNRKKRGAFWLEES